MTSAAPTAPFPRRACLLAAALWALDVGGAYVLDALGLVEGLLSPHGAGLALLVPLAAAFYLARLVLLFVAPGFVLGAILLWLADRRRPAREGATSGPPLSPRSPMS